MTVEIDLYQLKCIISEAASLGAQEALAQAGINNRYITSAAAYKLYGRPTIDKWVKAGLLKVHKNGSNNSMTRIDRLEIESLIKGTKLFVLLKSAA